jgi:hypothetical protein
MFENIHPASQAGKYSFMMNEKNNQLELEHEAWKRSLEFYKQENALLKYRLSERVDKSEGDHFLQTAEYFHNEFLLKDEWLVRLSQQLQSFQEKLHTASGNVFPEEKSLEMQNELRQQIWQFERDFLQLSNDFNQKVLKSIL